MEEERDIHRRIESHISFLIESIKNELLLVHSFLNQVGEPIAQNPELPVSLPPDKVNQLALFLKDRRLKLQAIANESRKKPVFREFIKETQNLITHTQAETPLINQIRKIRETGKRGIVRQLTRRNPQTRHLNETLMGLLNRLRQLLQEDLTLINQFRMLSDNIKYLWNFYDESLFVVEDFKLNGIAMTLYRHTQKSNKKGILIVPGFADFRQNWKHNGLRFAAEGYTCIAIDFPGQGESDMPYRIGIASEWVAYMCAYLRSEYGCHRVGVLGASHGGLASLLALAGSSYEFERDSNILLERVGGFLRELEAAQKTGDARLVKYILEEIDSHEKSLKELLRKSIVAHRFQGGGRSDATGGIDAFVGAIVPFDTPHALPVPPVLFAQLKHIPKSWIRKAANAGFNNPVRRDRGFLSLYKLNTVLPAPGKAYAKGPAGTDPYFGSVIISDVNDFVNYLLSVRNPGDFLNLLRFYSGNKENGTARSPYLRNVYHYLIGSVPKLFVIGNKDTVVKPNRLMNMLSFSEKQSLESLYLLAQNAQVRRFDGVGHAMVSGKIANITDLGSAPFQAPAVMEAITSFFNHHL